MVAMLDLDDLRERLAPSFVEYDRAVHARNTPDAYRLKMSITNGAVAALDREVSRQARGMYFFVSKAQGSEKFVYVGMACPGTIRDRIKKRFQAETCLDRTLYKKDRSFVWERAYRRICVSMDERGNRAASRPDLKLKYAFEHAKTLSLLEKASGILFFESSADQFAVKSAESLLIYTGISLGAPLVNIQERDNLVADLKRGEEIAFAIMSQLPDADLWASNAREILGRFRGECC